MQVVFRADMTVISKFDFGHVCRLCGCRCDELLRKLSLSIKNMWSFKTSGLSWQ